MSEPNIQEVVKEKYGAAAKQVAEGKTACCGGGASLGGCGPITRNLYGEAEKGRLPADPVAPSLGRGDPAELAEILAGGWGGPLAPPRGRCCFSFPHTRCARPP